MAAGNGSRGSWSGSHRRAYATSRARDAHDAHDMKRIVIIVNRVARELAREGAAGSMGSRGLLDVLRAKRPGVRVVETSSMAELDAAAEEIAREVPDAVVLAGGDGSYMAGVTALSRAFAAAGRGEDVLPPIALAPGGTVSTVARNWGFKGGGLFSGGTRDASTYTWRLLDAMSAGRAKEHARPTLRCAGDDETRIGFIVGAGLVSRFFEVYEEEGARGYRGAASIVARIFAGSFAKGRLAERVLSPVACSIAIDGVRVPFDETSLVCASVVPNLGIGMRLLYRAGESMERFHVVATPLGPSRLGPQLPLVLAGRALVGARNVDTLAGELTLRFFRDGDGGDQDIGSNDGAYVLDGELFRAEILRVTAGPVLRILSV